MSWDEYKKKREEEQSNSSWDRYKQQRENPNRQSNNIEVPKTNNNENSIWDKINYTVSKFSGGALSGTTGVAQSGILDMANNAQKGKEKSALSLTTDLTKSILGIMNPMQMVNNNFSKLPSYLKETVNNITDKDKTIKEKIINQGLNANNYVINNIPLKDLFNTGTQLAGKINPNLDETLLKANEEIRKPSENYNKFLAEESKKYDNTTNFIASGFESVGNMIPSIVGTALTKNPSVGLATMGLNVKGQATQEALDKGKDLDTAVKIGDAKALVEMATEKISGGAKIFGKGNLDDLAEELVKKGAKSKVGKFLLTQLTNTGGEILEEEISNIANNLIDKGTTDPDKKIIDLKEGLETMGSTAFTTTLLNLLTGGMVSDYKGINTNQYEDNKTIDNTINQNNTHNFQQESIQEQQILPTQQINQEQNNIAQNGNMEQILPSQQNDQENNITQKTELPVQNSQFYNNKNSYEVQDIGKTTSVFKNDDSYTWEQVYDIEDNVNNDFDLYSINDKSGKRTGYINLYVNDNNQLEVQKISDKTDDVIDSITVKPNKDKKFTGESINKAIEELTLNKDIAPIPGQIDITGNQYNENVEQKNNQTVQNENIEYQKRQKTVTNQDNIKQYTQNDINRFTTGKNNLIDGYNSNIYDFVNEHYDEKTKMAKKHPPRTKEKKMFLGRINDKLSESLNNLINNSNRFEKKYNLKDYNIVLSENNIEHSFNRHGNEKEVGQIDVTPEILAKYGDVISDPDYIGLSDEKPTKREPNPKLIFAKKINGYSVAIEVISDKKQLFPKAYYAYDSNSQNWNDFVKNKKLKEVGAMDSDKFNNFPEMNVQDDTAVTSSINNSIPHNNNKVNDNTITNNSMQNNQNNTQKEANLPTKGEKIVWGEMERPEGKIRKHYRSIIESSNTTKEAKAIAKELMGSDTYIPESNKKQLNEADRRISTNGADNELKVLTSLSNRIDAKITASDIAVGERLIEYYSKIGDKAKLQEAIQTTAMAGTQAGQTVQALSLLNHQTPQGQVTWIQRSVDKMNQELIKERGEDAPQFKFTPEMQQKIMETTNKQEMNKVIDEVYEELGEQVPKSRLGQIDSWRYFSMLANPKTHIRNIVGNVAMGKMQTVKNKVAGTIESTVAKFNPDMERTHTLKPASKEVKQFAKSDIENVADRLELNDNKYNPKSRLEGSMRTFKSDAMENTLGKIFDLNEKALEVEDGWGLKSGYVKALSEYMTANNLNPETITDKQLAKARNYAIAEAKEATFHAENAIATAINQFSRKGKLSKGITDAVLPFVKTPMNVAKAGIEYNPAGLIKTLTADTVKLRKGNITVNKYIDNLSKGLTGTGIAILGYAMAEAGILKASGGDDEKKEKFDEALGRQAYSIEINGKTYSLDWLAPAGIPLFVGAEAHNINKVGKDEKNSISTDDDKKSKQIIESLENWANAISNSMSPMAEMSMISGLTSALKSYDQDSQKMLGTIGTNAVKSYVNQFIPTALGQVARTSDEYERSTTSTKTGVLSKAVDQTKLQAMSKIPGLRQQLPVRTDVWGKEQKQEGSIVEKGFKNAILPFTIKNISNSKVDKELNELYNQTGETSILPSTSLDKTYTINGQKYRMTNEEYTKYKKEYGQNSYKLLEGLISSKEYKDLTNEQKQKAIESVYSYAKEKNKIDYAKNNNLEIKESTIYNTLEDLNKNKGNQSSYLSYLGQTTGMEKESDKNKILSNSNYTPKTKSIIYRNGTGKDDDFYNIVAKNTDLNIDEYLKYKIQNSEKAFEADKDEDGKTISGSAKKKIFDYVNQNITGYENRLLILASSYKLSNKERNDLADYINKKSLNNQEAIETFKKLTKNFDYKDGKIYYK